MQYIARGDKCPHCGEPLTSVQIETTTVLEWSEEGDPESEDFECGFADGAQGSGICRCKKCGKEIGGYGGGKNWGLWASED